MKSQCRLLFLFLCFLEGDLFRRRLFRSSAEEEEDEADLRRERFFFSRDLDLDREGLELLRL